MTQLQRFVIESSTSAYDILVESSQPIQNNTPTRSATDTDNDYESYSPSVAASDFRVKLTDIHHMIQGYAEYALGAFKNLSSAEVEEITLKFNIKVSAEGGLPILVSGKTESDFAIEVKCKFPK